MRGTFRFLAAALAALFFLAAPVAAQIPVNFKVGVEGTAEIISGGLSIEFLTTGAPVPIQFGSGVQVVNYRVNNLATNLIHFTDIAVRMSGDAKSKLTCELGDSALDIPVGGHADSTITVTALEPLYDGEEVTLYVTGTATAATFDFDVTITASATSGVIPLGLAFNNLTTDPPDGNLRHECWTTWNYAGAVAPMETELPCGAAVWTTAGTYLVECHVITPDGKVGYGSISITANDFTTSNRTFYVKSGGNNALSGLDDTNAWATFEKVRTELSDESGYRVLFHGGDAFTQPTNWLSEDESDIVLSTYGTGKAIIDRSGASGECFRFHGCNRISVSNLELRGVHYSNWNDGMTTPNTDDQSSHGINFDSASSRTHDNITIYNCDFIGWGISIAQSSGSSTDDGLKAIVCHTISVDKSYGYNIYLGASETDSQSGFINITCNGVSKLIGIGLHTMRAKNLRQSILWNCTFKNNRNVSIQEFTCRAGGTTEPDISKDVYIGHCTFGGPNTACATTAQVHPTNPSGPGSTEWIQDVVFDSCIWKPGTNTSGTCLWFAAKDCTVRNCSFLGAQTCVQISKDGSTVGVGGFRFIGDAWYTPQTTGTTRMFYFVESGIGVGSFTDNIIRNCAMHAPNATSPKMIIVPSDTWMNSTAPLADSNNCGRFASGIAASAALYIDSTTDCSFASSPAPNSAHGHDIVYDDPDWVDDANGDYHLESTSPLIGHGYSMPADSNFDAAGVARGTTLDIGPLEYAP